MSPGRRSLSRSQGDSPHETEPGGSIMPRGSKAAYTDKQKRQAEHIEQGYEKRGVSKKTAEARAWATMSS